MTLKARALGLGLFAAGALPALVLFAQPGAHAAAIPLGAALVALASLGLVLLLRDRPLAARSAEAGSGTEFVVLVEGRLLVARLAAWIAAAAALVVALRLAVSGGLPAPRLSSGVLVTSAFILAVAATVRLADVFSTEKRGRALHRRHGFWLAALAALLYVPTLGSFSLLDPWEPHYGEVAREILARDDWLSLWWGHEGWFFSKPVLAFWLEALSASLLGVRFAPGQMLAGLGEGRLPSPEWALRFPALLLSVAASLALYRALAARLGRRAAFVAGLALVTAPFWFSWSRQATTDMPYVACVSLALALALAALRTPSDARARVYALPLFGKRLSLSAMDGVLAAIACVALAQVLLLVSRHLTPAPGSPTAFGALGLGLHADAVLAGSGLGACATGLPGVPPCGVASPVFPAAQPGLLALLWLGALLLLVWLARREERLQRVYFLGAWLFVALASLAKGAPGLVLPLAIILSALLVERRLRVFLSLQLPSLGLILGCVTLPWFAQLFARHGHAFVNRLLIHDMFKRAFVGVHDTSRGEDLGVAYYAAELAYGLFPWTGFAALGLLAALVGSQRPRRERETTAFLTVWFLVAFGLFSVTRTKFHHYIFPAAPPAALLAGLFVARLLPRGRLFARRPRRVVTGTRTGTTLASAPASRVALIGLTSAGVTALVGLSLVGTNAKSGDGPSRLIGLFTYDYRRAWPESLDFRPVLLSLTLAASVACLLVIASRTRALGAALLGVTALGSSVWALDLYLVQLAPHWGEREAMSAYYAARRGPEEPLATYQLNWKGDRFYSGGQAAYFGNSGEAFQAWLAAERVGGHRTVYLTTEQGRLRVLERELGEGPTFNVLVPPTASNRFTMTRLDLGPPETALTARPGHVPPSVQPPLTELDAPP